jgi:hypothetical protein
MVAPGFGSIHNWITGGKGRKHHEQPREICSSDAAGTSVVLGGPWKVEDGGAVWGRRRSGAQGSPDNPPR